MTSLTVISEKPSIKIQENSELMGQEISNCEFEEQNLVLTNANVWLKSLTKEWCCCFKDMNMYHVHTFTPAARFQTGKAAAVTLPPALSGHGCFRALSLAWNLLFF